MDIQSNHIELFFSWDFWTTTCCQDLFIRLPIPDLCLYLCTSVDAKPPAHHHCPFRVFTKIVPFAGSLIHLPFVRSTTRLSFWSAGRIPETSCCRSCHKSWSIQLPANQIHFLGCKKKCSPARVCNAWWGGIL